MAGYSRPLPVIGNLHILTSLPHRSLHNLAKNYGGIMSVWLGNIPSVVVSSPRAAELFLKTQDTIFACRPKNQASEYLSYSTTGMAFTEYALRSEEVRSLVWSVKKAAEAREVVDVSKKV
ncbi:hypothetical protein TIFTF001_038851 [Ficus carica]|uniref:Cytochrome P450 n=1 Tax=Ficus carica TaxID=3494 RepID=A0AA88E9N9_FICCA|nr:hypothetical protein TIFTF001_038851 [Ficus carica]